tara:strand:+ start:201 stop:950 length:750 start_codon:yes stop_codon:yes gene_type:complete
MKALILAAGAGSRLNEITGGSPKSLIDINGTPLIQRQIDLLKKNNVDDIIIIRGFKANEFQLEDVTYVDDTKFDEHDQLGSLISAEAQLNDDLLITFGDIVFDENIIEQILSSESNFAAAVDLDWVKSYKKRIDNPIELAGKVLIRDGKIEKFSENLPVTKEGFLIGEFLGIIKLKKSSTIIMRKSLQDLKDNHDGKFHDAKSFQCAKITDMLQELIESEVEINPIFIKGKWCEIDTPKDLQVAREKFL